ncbi:MAG: helix-turn-helix transcriptional regulator [Bacilli bacterium]
MAPGLNAKRMFFYVQEIGHFYTLPNYSTERENLDSFLVAYTVSGKGYLEYRGQIFPIAHGQVFFINCEEYQYYYTDKEHLWEFIWVHLNGAVIDSYWNQFMNNGGPVLTLDNDTPVIGHLTQLIECCSKREVTRELMASKLIVELLTELLIAGMGLEQQLAPSFLPDYIGKIQNMLDKKYREHITLDDIASEFSVSKFHLIREFGKYVGITPNEYLINTRISAAKRLLRSSNLSIADIAAEVGIGNVSHFINTFKKRENITPLVFRKKVRV